MAGSDAKSISDLNAGHRRLRHALVHMTGFSALPVVEDEGDDAGVQWAGVSRILGPRWAQLPALTVGLLGLQVMWSIEFSYGEFI